MKPRRTTLLLAAVSLLSSLAFAGAEPKPLPPMTPEKWKADVDYVARELPKRHKNAFHTTTKEKFAAAIAALRAQADTASDDAMLVGLMQLTAMVGDGHTRVSPPTSIHQLPIGVALVEGSLRVVRGAEPGVAKLVGGRLTKIDNMPVEDAVAKIRTILPQAESDVLVEASTPQWLSIPEVLHGLGIAKSASKIKFSAVQADGTEWCVDMGPVETTAKLDWKLAAASPPPYRQRPGEGLWYTWLEDKKTVYVSWRNYEGLGGKAKEMWEFVDAHPVEKIAIDMRLNGGGDFFVGKKHMVDELLKRPKLRPFVIVGNRTFSAALKNAIDFRNAKVMLVGETIGERPNSYSENDEMTLPNSRLVMSYSTKYYQFLPEDGLVQPDKEIQPTWADWEAGRDPVLEWILQQ